MPIQAETLEAHVKVTGVSQAEGELKKVGNAATGTGKQVKSAGAGMKRAFAGLAVGGAAFKFLKDANAEARESQKVNAQTGAVLKSTGMAARVTAGHIGTLANAISKKTGIDDEAIQSGQNLILTFTNIRNGVGKTNKIFDQATRAAVDMGAALGGDPSSNAILLGKALNNPTKGLVALTRVGVTFSDQQKNQIASMQKTGNVMGAQKVILKELRKEFGGSAAAQATWGDKAKVAWKNLEEQVGTGFQPVFDKALKSFTNDAVPAIAGFVSGMQDGTGAGGAFADSFKRDVVPALKDVVNVGKDLLPFFKGLGTMTHEALKLFESLPAPLRTNVLLMGGMALGVSKITSSIGPMVAGLANAETRAASVASGMGKLKMASLALAGAAGIMAVADAGNRTDKTLGTLEGGVGGLVAGAAIGTMIMPGLGTAIGGVAGIIGGGIIGNLTSGAAAIKDMSDEAKAGAGQFDHYSQTLEGISAKATQATKDLVILNLEKKDAGGFSVLRNAGVNDTQATNAYLHGGKARQAVTEKLNMAITAQNLAIKQQNELIALAPKNSDYKDNLIGEREVLETQRDQYQLAKKNLGLLDADVRAQQHRNALARNYGSIQSMIAKGVPKATAKALDKSHVDINAKSVAAFLATQKGLKQADIKPTMKVIGLEPTTKNLNAVKTQLDKLKNRPPTKVVAKYDSLAALQNKVLNIIADINRLNGMHVGPGAPQLAPTAAPADGGTIGAMAFGGTVGGAPRTPYGDKVLAILAPGEEVISNRHGQADKNRRLLKAINANKFANGGTAGRKGKGPSLGSLLGGQSGNLLEAIKVGLGPVTQVLNRMERIVRQRAKGAQRGRLEKILKAQGDRLEKVQKRRDAINAKYNAAVTKRDDLIAKQADFKSAVTEGIKSQANVLNSGNNAADISANLATQAGKAQEFAKAIQDLRAKGYSSAVIQQVASAGIEGGLEVAKALVAGSASDVSSINSNFASITKAADDQGRLLAGQFYDAGINSAKGVVKGLQSQKKEIEATLTTIAKGMVKALRHALGIKSPSKVMRKEMGWVGKGLVAGLADQAGMVSAASGHLAAAAINGFSSGGQNLTPASMGGTASGAGVAMQFNTYYPLPEPQSVTTNKALDRVAALGLV